ncbi:cell division protein FtsA [Virgibacillus litoralis]|uniref:Cell division protein FtsA n=1 Tax=Virgibacillus litoralis TaxID=578221 RepID=A0ABS4HAA2_9BACI|nr:cell division protein FtsA [Virgibacillus litoralis]MBP1947830.1 cell division protein FtsA [Virgibacillus litoralis]
MGGRIFALDIGTRSVTGILIEKQDNNFAVIDYYMKEHEERSMRDGQIHNVIAVSEVIRDVKEKLETEHGQLNQVSVAAAGRALKTCQAEATLKLDQHPITDSDSIKHLELSAVQAAQLKLAAMDNNNEYTNYYCVGYSVLEYKLDDEQIGSLIDQSGDQATVKIIATFLPKVVVESLLAALGRADLEMEALTLEPIAAIHVLIPESMRRLNVALVDIGAGTSDIAITDKGAVVAYGMVPVAGDEITEAISDQYLLDFPMAEQTKKNIVSNGQATVQDILGFETTITYETLIEDIKNSVEKVADSVTTEILDLNSKSPKAVMLVGGGSLTPNITTALANKLQLPKNRVATRGINAIQHLVKTEKLPPGPDFVTPIGIAIAAKQNPVHYITVTVNEHTIRMFEMKQLTIGDCLVQAGLDIKKLYGKPGIASIVTVDGKEITLPGEYGQPPVIILNHYEATVDDVIHNGDEIIISKGSDGKEPHITIEELIGEGTTFVINFNNKRHELETTFSVNGQTKPKSYLIQDNDEIIIRNLHTINDFLVSKSTEKLQYTQPFSIFANDRQVTIDKGESHIYLNNKKVNRTHPLKQNDSLTIISAQHPMVKDVLPHLDKEFWNTITVTFNGKSVLIKQQQVTVLRDQLELGPDTELNLNDELEIKDRKQETFIFQDVFRYVDVDMTSASGHFQLYNNNQPTTFNESIQNGDKLQIVWGKKKS